MPLSKSKRIIKSEELPHRDEENHRGLVLIRPLAADAGRGDSFLDDTPNGKANRRDGETSAFEAEKEAIRRQSFQEGYRQAQATHLQEAAGHMERLKALLQELSRLKREILKDSEQEILRLALAIAAKILRSEAKIDPGYLLPIIRESIVAIDARSIVKIRLRPDDLRYLRGVDGSFLEELENLRNIVLEEDRAVAWGGAIIETTSGELDARLEKQLDELEQGLLSLPRKSTT